MSDEKEIPKWKRVLKPAKPVFNEQNELLTPPGVNPELFAAGYWHGRTSTTLIDFRYSFRMGFRKAMLERREEEQLKFAKFQTKTIYEDI